MYAVVRIRGPIGKSRKVNKTMNSIGLKKNHNMVIVDKDKLPVVSKLRDYVTWGEVSEEIAGKFTGQKAVKLSSPRKGFKSIKMIYPKGDLGYRGDKINNLIERMLSE